jgi:hypothetical protein
LSSDLGGLEFQIYGFDFDGENRLIWVGCKTLPGCVLLVL